MKKCLVCRKSFNDNDTLKTHIESEHSDVLPDNWSGLRYNYYLKYNKPSGNCIICGKETEWNDATEKPFRLCTDTDKCKTIYRDKFKANMVKVYGKEHLLNDPDVQKKMLSNRKISGKYKWSDSNIRTDYVGSYELDFLKFLDIFMGFNGKDVMSPAPQIFNYEYQDKTHFYIPDFYIQSINTVVEIKDGGDNPNMHHKIQDVDKEKEQIKDSIMQKQTNYNYIKVTNKNYGPFIKFLIDIKNKEIENVKDDTPVILISEQLESVLNESFNNYDNKNEIFVVECKVEDKSVFFYSENMNLKELKTFALYDKNILHENKCNIIKLKKNNILETPGFINIMKNEYLNYTSDNFKGLEDIDIKNIATNVDISLFDFDNMGHSISLNENFITYDDLKPFMKKEVESSILIRAEDVYSAEQDMIKTRQEIILMKPNITYKNKHILELIAVAETKFDARVLEILINHVQEDRDKEILSTGLNYITPYLY